MAVTIGDICKIILAVILPPLGVFAEKERCDKDVLINILLTVLGYIPGRCQQTGIRDIYQQSLLNTSFCLWIAQRPV